LDRQSGREVADVAEALGVGSATGTKGQLVAKIRERVGGGATKARRGVRVVA
jgi:hypothetical protein